MLEFYQVNMMKGKSCRQVEGVYKGEVIWGAMESNLTESNLKRGVKTLGAMDVTNVLGSVDKTFSWHLRVIGDGMPGVNWKDGGDV